MLSAVAHGGFAQEVVRLWDGVAPGSERWNYEEEWGEQGATVCNVTNPTLTAYLPGEGQCNGTAVVICPGGAFRFLAWEAEGVQIAKRLNARGIAAFILKYRVVRTGGPRPEGEPLSGGAPQRPASGASRYEREFPGGNAIPNPEDAYLNRVVRLAIDDGQQAIRHIRTHAEVYGVDPDRIGVMGFSAGGGVAIGTALQFDDLSRPDFLVSVYGPALTSVDVPETAPPLFIAVAADHMPVAPACMDLFKRWKTAGRDAEMHVYADGRGPFGAGESGVPSGAWLDRFLEWLDVRIPQDRWRVGSTGRSRLGADFEKEKQ